MSLGSSTAILVDLLYQGLSGRWVEAQARYFTVTTLESRIGHNTGNIRSRSTSFLFPYIYSPNFRPHLLANQLTFFLDLPIIVYRRFLIHLQQVLQLVHGQVRQRHNCYELQWHRSVTDLVMCNARLVLNEDTFIWCLRGNTYCIGGLLRHSGSMGPLQSFNVFLCQRYI